MKRVYIGIVGDLLHYGHLRFFEKSKELGDYLIVGVHGDDDVERFKRRPICDLQHRMEMIRGCKSVDEVLGNAPAEVTQELIETNRIDIVVCSEAYCQSTIDQYYGVPQEMGILHKAPYTKTVSTTEIIKKCHALVEREGADLGSFS